MSIRQEEALDRPHQIGVIGSTGFVGSAVMRALRKAGANPISLIPRPLVHDAAVISTIKPGHSQEPKISIFRRFDFHDEQTFEPSMKGLNRLFLMRPPAMGDVERRVFPLLEIAVSAGVERIVFLSVSGAGTRAYLPHAKIEARLSQLARSAGLKVGILRPSFFAQNLLSAYREDIKHDDRLYVCAAGGKVAFVDTEDVGAIGARALLDGSLDGRAVTLTGSTALSFDDVATLLTAALKRTIVYIPASISGFLCHRVFHRGSGLMEALVITALHVGLRRGDAKATTRDVENLLGRPATTMSDVIARYRDSWLA